MWDTRVPPQIYDWDTPPDVNLYNAVCHGQSPGRVDQPPVMRPMWSIFLDPQRSNDLTASVVLVVVAFVVVVGAFVVVDGASVVVVIASVIGGTGDVASAVFVVDFVRFVVLRGLNPKKLYKSSSWDEE